MVDLKTVFYRLNWFLVIFLVIGTLTAAIEKHMRTGTYICLNTYIYWRVQVLSAHNALEYSRELKVRCWFKAISDYIRRRSSISKLLPCFEDWFIAIANLIFNCFYSRTISLSLCTIFTHLIVFAIPIFWVDLWNFYCRLRMLRFALQTNDFPFRISEFVTCFALLCPSQNNLNGICK